METIHMPETPDNYEQAAKMKLIEGKTWGQIAHALSISRGQMDNIKRRIKRDMKTAIKIMMILRYK